MINKSGTGIRKINVINRRMFILSAAKILIFSGIVTRLFSLQINENKKYLTLSDKNRLREWRLPPVRGDFLDYFGKKTSLESYKAVFYSDLIKYKKENISKKI